MFNDTTFVDEVYCPDLGKCQVFNAHVQNNKTVGSLKVPNPKRYRIINDKEVYYTIENAKAHFDFDNKRCSISYLIFWIGGEVEHKKIEFEMNWKDYKIKDTPIIKLIVFPKYI